MRAKLFCSRQRFLAMDYTIEATIRRQVAYCQANDWSGYDPYDALNSKIFAAVPMLSSRAPRLLFTQLLKRSPVNIRRLAMIPRKQNPKALALFLSSFLNLSDAQLAGREDLIRIMINRLTALRSPGVPHWCWGYSFAWQTRTVLVPTYAPNLVCTTFVAEALLDAFERIGDAECLTMAVSAGEYILSDLYWSEGEAAGFSYPTPGLKSHTHNANLMAAALLCRLAQKCNERKFLAPALRAARYAVSKQRPDGSWYYGESRSSRWIDNFHTGYNLGALQSIGRELATHEFDTSMYRGFEFYRTNFFRRDGAPKYFHDRDYPADIHCVAQSIITLVAFKEINSTNLELADALFRWAMTHMWDDRGFFYYRVLRLCKIRTPYMRWSQAWMLLALTTLLNISKFDSARESERQLAV